MMQKNNNFGMAPLMHSALVTCSLHLLTGCISSQWQDLVQVLLAHPKVCSGENDSSRLLLIETGFNWKFWLVLKVICYHFHGIVLKFSRYSLPDMLMHMPFLANFSMTGGHIYGCSFWSSLCFHQVSQRQAFISTYRFVCKIKFD